MISTGNAVKDFSIGKTHVKICDDYCRNKTKAEVEKYYGGSHKMQSGR